MTNNLEHYIENKYVFQKAGKLVKSTVSENSQINELKQNGNQPPEVDYNSNLSMELKSINSGDTFKDFEVPH